MQRLVTEEDLKKFPELIPQGVQVNQLYDFDVLEAADKVKKHEPKKAAPKKSAPKKAAPKKAAPKKAGTKKK